MNTNGLLDAHDLVLSSEEIPLTSELMDSFGERFTKEAREKAKDAATRLRVWQFSYRSTQGRVRGFLVEPKEGSQLPAIVYCRGGNKEFGKVEVRQLFVGTIAALADAGYVVFATQYAGNDGGEGEDEFGGRDVDDVEALATIAREYGRASGKLGLYGGSRGGMMVYQTLARGNTLVHAAVTVAGLADLKRQRALPPKPEIPLSEKLSLTPDDMDKRSVLCWPEKIPSTVPMLLMHGTADWRVSVQDSLNVSKKFIELRKPHRLILFEGADHNVNEVKDEARLAAISWFDRFVKGSEPLPNLELHGG